MFHDKNLKDAFIFNKRSGFDKKRGYLNITTSGQTNTLVATKSIPTHTITPAIKNFNRYEGLDIRYNEYGRWVKDETSNYQKFYRVYCW